MAQKHVISNARDFAARNRTSPNAEKLLLPHLDEVAVLVRAHGEQHQTVAYLHHVLEDGQTTLGHVERDFGSQVAKCVALFSGERAEDPKERRRRMYAEVSRIKATDPEAVALVVAAADRLARVQDCYLKDDKGRMRKYRQDHREFRRAVFRPGLADELWNELTELIAW